MSKTVEIIVGKDGAIEVSAHGFSGTSCEEATEFLDNLFKRTNTDYKDCYYEINERNILVDPVPEGHCG